MRKWSKRLCWQPRFAREGRAVSSLRVRWKRSCRPFCSGWLGSISSGEIPSRIHHDGEPRYPPDRLAGERRAVVAADDLGEPVFAEGPFQSSADPIVVGTGEAL